MKTFLIVVLLAGSAYLWRQNIEQARQLVELQAQSAALAGKLAQEQAALNAARAQSRNSGSQMPAPLSAPPQQQQPSASGALHIDHLNGASLQMERPGSR